MVMRLPCPDTVNADFLDQIVNERQGGTNAAYFNSVRDAWKTRVHAYTQANGNPELLKPWPGVDAHKAKYVNLYLSPREGSAQANVLSTLRSRKLQLCPACGEDGTPNTLDHYLPKQIYPEFAITPCNLFPMCDACQGEKSTKTVNSANQRLFLHPYFDQVAESQVVSLRIGRPMDAPASIEIHPHASLSAADAALVERHLKELDIADRYYRFFRDEYGRLRKLVHESRTKGQDVRRNLELFARHASYKSPNSWGHIMYTGVLADEELMTYLEEGPLPTFI